MIMTKRADPILEPTTQRLIDALATEGGTPLYILSYADARKVLKKAQAIDISEASGRCRGDGFPGWSDRRSLRSHLSSNGSHRAFPLVRYFHGGAWVLGSKDTHDRLLGDLVNGVHARGRTLT